MRCVFILQAEALQRLKLLMHSLAHRRVAYNEAHLMPDAAQTDATRRAVEASVGNLRRLERAELGVGPEQQQRLWVTARDCGCCQLIT